MKFLRLTLLMVPLLFIPFAFAQTTAAEDGSEYNTGTFEADETQPNNSPEQLKMEKQQKMENQDETEVDSFGEDEYNQNVDPDAYNDEEYNE